PWTVLRGPVLIIRATSARSSLAVLTAVATAGVSRAGVALVAGGVVGDRHHERAAGGRPSADADGASMLLPTGDVGGVRWHPVHWLRGCPCGDGRHPAHVCTAVRARGVMMMLKQGPRSAATSGPLHDCVVFHAIVSHGVSRQNATCGYSP